MNKTENHNEDQLIETLALTAKIQNKLKNLISIKKLHHQYGQQDQLHSQSTDLTWLHQEIMRLREENRNLLTDNEQLCRDLLRLKQEKEILDKEAAQNRNHIRYLQEHCKTIKKQLLFWVRKPTSYKAEVPQINNVEQILMLNEVQRLRRENDARQVQLQRLKERDEPNHYTTPLKAKHKRTLTNSNYQFPCQQVSSLKASTAFIKKNSCTSCNYFGLKNKFKAKHKRTTSQMGLCECHKQYLQTGKFKG